MAALNWSTRAEILAKLFKTSKITDCGSHQITYDAFLALCFASELGAMSFTDVRKCMIVVATVNFLVALFPRCLI